MWQVTDDVFGTWLGYSAEHDALLQAGAKASDRLAVESSQGMAVYSGSDGSLRWKNDSLDYAGPCILHNDLIITNANSNSESAGAYYLADGKPKLVKNPLTGGLQPWRVSRAYGCNNIVASENLLTFRSGAASFYDLLNEAGTGNLGGFKSGCTSNLVVANGVLNAPDYTRTCSCAYQNQTSLALVHMPEIEVWSVNTSLASKESTALFKGQAIQELAINFGAPGDRRDAEGTLWLEYPVVAGPSPQLSIETNEDVTFFQQHSSTVKTADLPWVLASGVEGVSDLRIHMRLSGQDQDQPAPGGPQRYDVRLLFGAPSASQGKVRIFDVEVQGQRMIEGLTLDPSGQTASAFAVHRLEDIAIAEDLQLRFVARQGSATLSGIEIVQRTSAQSQSVNSSDSK